MKNTHANVYIIFEFPNKKLKKKIKRKKIVNNIFIVLSAFLATFVIVDAL